VRQFCAYRSADVDGTFREAGLPIHGTSTLGVP